MEIYLAIVIVGTYLSIGFILTSIFRDQFNEEESYNAIKYTMYDVKHFGFWTFMFVWLTWIVTLPYVKWVK